MADIRTLSYEAESLDTLRVELRYTERRLAARPETAALALPFHEILARWPGIRDQQHALWDAEEDANVLISNTDDDADDFVDNTSRALLHHLGSKEHPLYQRLFGALSPSELQALSLEPQRAKMADWPSTLRLMPAEMGPAADQAQALLDAGRTALDARVAANVARAGYRITTIRGFFEEANALRLTTFAQLLQQSAMAKRPKNWPKRFFKAAKKTKKAAAVAA